MSVVDLTRSARKDLLGIGDYIAHDNAERAALFLEELADTFERVADMPLIGRSRSDIRLGLRSFVHRDYLIFYRPVRDGISIIRVVHGRRDIGQLFR